MKIIFISVVPSPYQRDIFKALSKKVDLQVYYLEQVSPDSPWPKKELEPFEMILKGRYFSVGGKRFLVNWIFPRLNKSDLIILNGYMGLVFQWILRFHRSKKIIFWAERMTLGSQGLKGVLQKFLSKPIAYCNAIVAIGSRAQIDYQKLFPNNLIFNIPYHCSLTEFQKIPLKVKVSEINILFCGQMISRKGLDTLVAAFDRILSKYTAKLHLVGREAELPEILRNYAQTTTKNIINHGFQDPDKLAEFFEIADVFVLPSRYDGWGVVVNQALGAGLPVICSDQVGAGFDLVDEGKNGFRFKAGNVNELHDKIELFITNSELIPMMSKKSREKSLRLDPNVGAEKWVKVLQEIV